MGRDKTFLVGVDDSDASIRSISYMADMMEGRQDCRIVLFHVLPPIPPELLEFGGAEDPGTEQKLEATLKKDQAQWAEKAKQEAGPMIDNAKTILHRIGIAPAMISTAFSRSIHRPDIVRELTEAAQAQDCGTIVVGKESYSNFKEMFHHHVGEALVRQVSGVAIWVIT